VIDPPVEFAGFDDDPPSRDELRRERFLVLAFLHNPHVDGIDRDIETSIQLQNHRNQFKRCRIVELVDPAQPPVPLCRSAFQPQRILEALQSGRRDQDALLEVWEPLRE
jgi:hypothetical protein